jgi:hypothetical protein
MARKNQPGRGQRRIRAGAFPPAHRFSRIANRAGTL